MDKRMNERVDERVDKRVADTAAVPVQTARGGDNTGQVASLRTDKDGMRTQPRLAVPLIAVSLLVGGVSACGGTTTSTSGTTPVASTTSSSSASAAAFVKGKTVARADFLELIKKGLQSSTSYSMDMTMTSAGAKTTMKGSVDRTDAATPKMRVTMQLPSGGSTVAADIIVIGGDLYLRYGGSGQPYLKTTTARMKAESGTDLSASFTSPVEQLAKQGSVMTSITYVGDETVGGTPTRRFSILVDLKAAMSLAGNTAAASAASDGSTVPYDMWLDEGGHPRKFTMTMKSGSVTSTVAGTAGAYGTKVTIVAPPADQVRDMPAPA